MLSNEMKSVRARWLQLTQRHRVRFAALAPVLLDQRCKGDGQDILAFPRALTGSGDLSQLKKYKQILNSKTF